MAENSKTVGARLLLAWRRAGELTQLQASLQLEMDPTRYSSYETGRGTPNLQTARRIEDKTSIPMRTWTEPDDDLAADLDDALSPGPAAA